MHVHRNKAIKFRKQQHKTKNQNTKAITNQTNLGAYKNIWHRFSVIFTARVDMGTGPHLALTSHVSDLGISSEQNMASAISNELSISSLGKNFLIGTSIGIGIGVGIGIGIIATHKLLKSNYSNERIILFLTEMNQDLSELQTVSKRLESRLNQLQGPVQVSERERNLNFAKETNSLRTSSDDEDEEFYDMDKDDEIVEFFNRDFIGDKNAR